MSVKESIGIRLTCLSICFSGIPKECVLVSVHVSETNRIAHEPLVRSTLIRLKELDP